ncbi:MAG: YdeI/OmpD-associated family protein [Thermoflavifilum sp.]|nr:YdeI/OmpD-associated family protein [Thermoflavifilum sp.]MCL6514991.1 YdeI family protein [Alicyclobacillus sp.]
MTESRMNPKVDAFLNRAEQWREEFEQLRRILLDGPVTEELKWGVPCYTYQNKNIVLMHGFKAYCALLFPKGALLKDPHRILVRQTENVQAARQVRFTSVKEILELEGVLRSYVQEAIEVEKAGLKVNFKKPEDYPIPQELLAKFEEMPALKAAFETLTPGRQRAYLLYFSQAKQAKTRQARIEKYLPRILEGKGMND